MLTSIVLLLFITSAMCETVVWDYYMDYCFFKLPPVIRPKERCEEVSGITTERYFFNNYFFSCITVNNTANIYKKIVIEMNEPKIYNDTTKNIDYLKTLEFDKYYKQYDKHVSLDIPKGLRFIYDLTPNYFVVGLKLFNDVTKEYPIDRIVSLKIDGMESCNQSRANDTDTIFSLSEPPENQERFLKHCLNLNLNRASPEAGVCENVDEVIVRKLILNGNIPFWCVTVDAKFDTDIFIEMDGANNHLTWNGIDVKLKYSEKGKYILNTAEQIVIAIEPNIIELPVLNITSLRINGLESCGIVLEQTACGLPQFTIQSFIANGQIVNPGQYPWHAAIFEFHNKKNLTYVCGGSIIGKNVILTAGHCVSNVNGITVADALAVKVGLNDLNKSTEFTKLHQVLKVILHEKFDINYLEHDIAILKLKQFLEYNSFVQPICLSQNAGPGPLNKVTGVVAGWGRNEKNKKQNLLSAATLPIISSPECRSSNRNFFQQFLNQWKFCAGYHNGTSICTGDSGGGFVVKFPKRWYLRGIVSLGVSERGFCALNEYVLFTDVIQYYKWIKSKLLS